MDSQIVIPANKRIWLMCATDYDRPVLRHVCIDPAEYAIAANGFALAVVAVKIEPNNLTDSILIRGDFLAKIAHVCRGKDIILKSDGDTICSAVDGIHLVIDNYADVAYPDWRSLVPRINDKDVSDRSISYVGLDQNHLSNLCKAIGAAFASLSFDNVSQPFIVTTGTDSKDFGVMMPRWIQRPDIGAMLDIVRNKSK